MKFEGDGEEMYEIVDSADADPDHGKISSSSVFAKALIGKRLNANVSYLNPKNQVVKCKVVAVMNS